MIKLINILNEDSTRDFLKKGYRLGNKTVDPETGKIGNNVEYLPELENIRLQLLEHRRKFKIFEFSLNPEISLLAKDISKEFSKLNKMISTLDKIMEINKNA